MRDEFVPVDDDDLQRFEREYAARSEITVTWLHEHGRFAVRCACPADDCPGFAMISVEMFPDMVALHRLPEP